MQLINIAFLSGLLLAPAVLTAPSGLAAYIARWSESRRSNLNDRLSQTVSNTQYSSNWAGAVWSEGNNTFNFVTGTFTVPVPSGQDGTSAAVWVGIDGDTCRSAILQTGIAFTVQGDQPTYSAWYEWYPAPLYPFDSDIEISAGDVVTLTVNAWNATTGTATIDNLTNGQTVFQDLSSSAPLCGQNAEWIVEDYTVNGALVPFADFGTVTFTNAAAVGAGTNTLYKPSGANILDIYQDDTVLTSVSTDGTGVTIQYTP